MLFYSSHSLPSISPSIFSPHPNPNPNQNTQLTHKQWLKTDLGSQAADLPVEVGAEKTLDKILAAGKEQNGEYLNIHVPGWENAPGPNKYDGKFPGW